VRKVNNVSVSCDGGSVDLAVACLAHTTHYLFTSKPHTKLTSNSICLKEISEDIITYSHTIIILDYNGIRIIIKEW
jgi:hypothetical protein